jgi:hypothetical protein
MKLYSLQEIRKLLSKEGLHIPDGTLRNYRDEFDNFLKKEGSGRFARYHKDAIDVFKEIRRLRKEEHLDGEHIKERLEQMCGTIQTEQAQQIKQPHQTQQTITVSPEALMALVNSVRNLDIRTKITQDHMVKLVSMLQQRFISENSGNTDISEIRSAILELRNALSEIRQAWTDGGHSEYPAPRLAHGPDQTGSVFETLKPVEIIGKPAVDESNRGAFSDLYAIK